jgi:hypothetical protein
VSTLPGKPLVHGLLSLYGEVMVRVAVGKGELYNRVGLLVEEDQTDLTKADQILYPKACREMNGGLVFAPSH